MRTTGAGAVLRGELDPWPDRPDMARLLEEGGLRVDATRHRIAIADFGSFAFDNYGGDISGPEVSARAESVDALVREAAKVSELLAAADIAHRFEVHDDEGELAAYLHHRWPCVDLSELDAGDVE